MLRRLRDLIDDSDSGEEILRPRRPRVFRERSHYFESYDDNDFAVRFRLSKASTLFLLSKIEHRLEYISNR